MTKLQTTSVQHALLVLVLMVMSADSTISFLKSIIDSAPNREFCEETTRLYPSSHLYSSTSNQWYNQPSCASSKILTRGFQKTALIFNNQNVSKQDNSAVVQPVCDFVYISTLRGGNSTLANLCNSAIPSLMNTDNESPLSIRLLTNDRKPLTLRWTNENIKNRVVPSYPPFELIYILYNEAVCVGTPSLVYIPTQLSTRQYFINDTNPGPIPRDGSCRQRLNVFGYQTLSVDIKSYYSRENLNCNNCYIQLGTIKYCTNASYEIDVAQGQTTLDVIVHCNNQGSYGITAAVNGIERPHTYHICKDDSSVIEDHSSFTLYSPNYSNSLREELDCRVGLLGYNLIDINVHTVGSNTRQNYLLIGDTQISLTDNKTMTNFRLPDRQATWFRLQIPPITGSVQYPAFSVQINAKKTQDIPCPGGSGSLVTLDWNSLPYYVTSPNFPEQYPSNLNCLFPIRVQDGEVKQNAMVEISLDIEEDSACIHDYVILDNDNTAECGKKNLTYQLSMLLNPYNVFTLQFRSDVSTTASGFIMKIYDPRPPTTTTQQPTTNTATSTIKPQTMSINKSQTAPTTISTLKSTTARTTPSAGQTTKTVATMKTAPPGAATKSPQKIQQTTPKPDEPTPSYVWMIVAAVVVLLVGGAIIGAVLVIRRQRRKKANDDGFENPMFGEMSFNNANSSD